MKPAFLTDETHSLVKKMAERRRVPICRYVDSLLAPAVARDYENIQKVVDNADHSLRRYLKLIIDTPYLVYFPPGPHGYEITREAFAALPDEIKSLVQEAKVIDGDKLAVTLPSKQAALQLAVELEFPNEERIGKTSFIVDSITTE